MSNNLGKKRILIQYCIGAAILTAANLLILENFDGINLPETIGFMALVFFIVGGSILATLLAIVYFFKHEQSVKKSILIVLTSAIIQQTIHTISIFQNEISFEKRAAGIAFTSVPNVVVLVIAIAILLILKEGLHKDRR